MGENAGPPPEHEHASTDWRELLHQLTHSELPPLEALLENPPAKRVHGRTGHIYGGKSLSCLTPADRPRRDAIFLIEWKLFDPFILLTIFANMVSMAAESPLDPPDTSKAAVIQVCAGTIDLVVLSPPDSSHPARVLPSVPPHIPLCMSLALPP